MATHSLTCVSDTQHEQADCSHQKLITKFCRTYKSLNFIEILEKKWTWKKINQKQD